MLLARNRLRIEVREAQKNPDDDVDLSPSSDNLYEWTACFSGPANSPYEAGRFCIKLNCAPDYPISPPTVIFTTPIFHPNIDFKTGELCLDVLKHCWSPAWTLQSVCRAIIVLLSDPNADSPLNCDAGNLVRSGDMIGFNSMARMYTHEYARQS